MGGYVPILILFLLMATGLPIVFCLLGSSLSYFMFINPSMKPYLLMQRLIASVESPNLWAIPFFIMAGSIMNYSGITKRLLGLANGLVGQLPGGLAQVNVLLSTMMGGISGSAAADAATQCKILVPEMERYGYDRPFCAAVTAASSIITPIIPPGITLILYASLANASVGQMFVAGYIPGIILCVSEMLLVHHLSKRNKYRPSRERMAGFVELGKMLLGSVWALMLPFVLIMGLRIGMFTATEGGAICAIYSAFVGIFAYKELKWRHTFQIVKDTITGTSAVVIIMCAANLFSWYMTYERIPQNITGALMEMNMNGIMFLLAVNLLYLFLGMFIEGGAIMIMLVPLILPTALALNINLIHLGILMVVNSAIGALSPPFGVILFLVASLLKLSVSDLTKALLPFVVLLIACLLLFIFVPEIVTFLPELVY